MFLSPVMITALSVPILGEHVGVRRWVGVAPVSWARSSSSGPERRTSRLAAFYFLAAALVNAGYQLLTRKIARIDDPHTTFFYTAIAGALAASLVVPYDWQTPQPAHWLLLVGMGVTGGMGHLFLIYAFEKAPVSAVAPFAYSALVWASPGGLHRFSGKCRICGPWPARFSSPQAGSTFFTANGRSRNGKAWKSLPRGYRSARLESTDSN